MCFFLSVRNVRSVLVVLMCRWRSGCVVVILVWFFSCRIGCF